jgi:glucosamine--fructose-6-phosphate aminotransferase (isomerizing)
VSWLETELREQPAALARFLETQGGRARELGALFRRDDVKYLLIASRGSSSNAARYAQYLLGRANRAPVAFATPSLYTIYEQPPRLEGALVIGISQSGGSPDVRAVIEEAARQGRPTLALTNDPSSPLAQASEFVLPLEAGEEKAVAATKTYLNSVAAVALLFAAATQDASAMVELGEMPELVAEQLKRSFHDARALDAYVGANGGTVVARGVNYGTAFEIALKIRELSGLVMEAYSAADLLHGPIAAIGEGWPVVVVAPTGPPRAGLDETIDALRERGARLIVVADDDRFLRRADTPLKLVRPIPEWLSPLTAVIPGQVAAMRLAELRGADLDNPHGLSKVTLTR